MVKIEAVIRPCKLAEVKEALAGMGVSKTCASLVRFDDGSPERRLYYRGAEYRADIVRLKLEVFVSSIDTDEAVQTILRAARTTLEDDDGTVAVFEMAEGVRIRGGQALLTAF